MRLAPPAPARVSSRPAHRRLEHVGDAYALGEFLAHTFGHHGDFSGAVVDEVGDRAEGPRAGGQAHDAGDVVGHGLRVGERLSALSPEHADPQAVADDITRIVGLPAGTRPFRSVTDFIDDGAAEVTMVAERVREEFARRIGIADMLKPVVRRAA